MTRRSTCIRSAGGPSRRLRAISGNGKAFRIGIRRDWAISLLPGSNGPRRSAAKFLRSNPAAARADNQQPGNGAIAFANDNNLSTYWYAGDNRPHGKLTVDFAQVEPVSTIRFYGFETGRHAPKDYRVGVILPDGSEKEIASVKDEKRMGQWISFAAKGVKAKGIYLDVASTVENEHGPVVYEFQGANGVASAGCSKNPSACRSGDSPGRHRRGRVVRAGQRRPRFQQAVESLAPRWANTS